MVPAFLLSPPCNRAVSVPSGLLSPSRHSPASTCLRTLDLEDLSTHGRSLQKGPQPFHGQTGLWVPITPAPRGERFLFQGTGTHGKLGAIFPHCFLLPRTQPRSAPSQPHLQSAGAAAGARGQRRRKCGNPPRWSTGLPHHPAVPRPALCYLPPGSCVVSTLPRAPVPWALTLLLSPLWTVPAHSRSSADGCGWDTSSPHLEQPSGPWLRAGSGVSWPFPADFLPAPSDTEQAGPGEPEGPVSSLVGLAARRGLSCDPGCKAHTSRALRKKGGSAEAAALLGSSEPPGENTRRGRRGAGAGARSREGTDKATAAESTWCPRTWGLGRNRGPPQRDWKPEPRAPGGGLQHFDQGRSEQSGMNWAPHQVLTFRPESPPVRL